MLRIALDSRKNGLITNVLQTALHKQEIILNGEDMDEVDSGDQVGKDGIFQVKEIYVMK